MDWFRDMLSDVAMLLQNVARMMADDLKEGIQKRLCKIDIHDKTPKQAIIVIGHYTYKIVSECKFCNKQLTDLVE